MDGLSGAANGIAVIALAIQLGDSIKKLCEFWTSVKEAPDNVRAITADLQLLSSVLAGIASEEQHFEPDPTLVTALGACRDNVIKLVRIADDMEPGFVSKKPRVRLWTAFKAAIISESIRKSQRILEGLKSTLTLALHNHHNRLNRIWHQSHQQDITTILRHLSSLNLGQTIAFRDEASRFDQTIHNPTLGVAFDVDGNVADRNVTKILSRDQSRNISSPPNPEDTHSTPGCYKKPSWARQRTWTMISGSLRHTFFGTITYNTRTRVLRPGIVVVDALGDEEYPYEQEESLKFLPAGWLLKLGFKCAYNFSIYDSSTQGWQVSIKSINLIPDDAPIFRYCEQGNIEMVRDLMSRNLASARDVDCHGRTALHFAAKARSPELCRFLIEAGADKSARTFGYGDPYWNERTPLRELISLPITQDGLVDAIDTCRIFDDCYDFWDGSGDGWSVLYLSMTLGRISDDEASAEFSSRFVQSASPEIKAYYDKDKVSNTIHSASCGVLDSISLLLELGPPGTVDHEFLRTTSLDESIICREYDKTRLLLACGADPHRLNFFPISHRVESPLSLAMYDSWAFCSFRDALMEMNFHVEDVVRRELERGGPLHDDGWQGETLSALLNFDFELEIEPPKNISKKCSNCGNYCWDWDPLVQPYWQAVLERVKKGVYLQNDRSDTQDVQSSSSLSHSSVTNTDSLTNATNGGPLTQDYVLPDDQSVQSDEEPVVIENATSRLVAEKEVVWCLDCWHYLKETGRLRSPPVTEYSSSEEEDSSDDDFSPFLFNT